MLFGTPKVSRRFGEIPSPPNKNMNRDYIEDYYYYDLGKHPRDYYLDDITWHDLNLNRVYDRMNNCYTTPGEEILHHRLRTPAITQETYEGRLNFLHQLEENPMDRQKMEGILAKLGKNPQADLLSPFKDQSRSKFWLLVYLLLSLALIASIIYCAFNFKQGALIAFVLFTINGLVHEGRKNSLGKDLDRVNYAINQVFAVARLKRLGCKFLDEELRETYKAQEPLKGVMHTGNISASNDGSFIDLLSIPLLLDLIAYEFAKVKILTYENEVIQLFQGIGHLDATISIASYRASLVAYTEPSLHFNEDSLFVHADNLVHPLLEESVPNDLKTKKSILITGSNASGKSTYLRICAINALLAQTMGTVLADSYEASVFRIYSSMALSDDLLAGESYYVAETQAIKRVLDACDEQGAPVLCTIDEVLRGTNTLERIAASSTILDELSKKRCLCLAATHDLELTDLLKDRFSLFHFEEQIEDKEMYFDYKLKEGKATSRNAINLLSILGFDEELVNRAHSKAQGYLNTGKW